MCPGFLRNPLITRPKKKKRMSARHNIRSTSIRLFTEESMMDVLPSLVFSFFRPCETIQLVGCLLCFWWIVPFKSCFDQQDERLHISPDKGLLSRPESWIFMETAIIGGGPEKSIDPARRKYAICEGWGARTRESTDSLFFSIFSTDVFLFCWRCCCCCHPDCWMAVGRNKCRSGMDGKG